MADDVSDGSGEMTREEAVQQLTTLSSALADVADELVGLLNEHRERKWADNFSRFSSRVRAAKSDRQLRDALEIHRSFYGGMGSWNDFYLQELGEAEERRGALTGHLWRLSDQLEAVLAEAPQAPQPSLWQRVFGRSGS